MDQGIEICKIFETRVTRRLLQEARQCGNVDMEKNGDHQLDET